MWIKVHDGSYRRLEDYRKLYVYQTGSEWSVGPGANADNIVQVSTQAEAEAALAKLVQLLGLVEL